MQDAGWIMSLIDIDMDNDGDKDETEKQDEQTDATSLQKESEVQSALGNITISAFKIFISN